MGMGRARADRFRGSWAEVVLAGVALGAVALLVVPLRPALLDVLLVSNLAASLVLLLLSLRVARPLALAAFPTWIVLSTLLRLALNVSSTRLILLEGSAGRVISSFGSLVAGSSVVVGAVLFALLSIVQLIVIAKGAERVAEVGARFHLDALPGKQMAIDAELNQGGLDARGAAQRRKELALESQFYGAMDGAMKFVKGDVIAAFVIVFVNLSGGFALGVTERGMDAVTSLTHYGLLTIGDGLVTQIPSLISATSAAVLVTRVSGDERGAGRQLASQFSRHPETLALVAAACVVLGALPGMPFAPFLLIALGLFGATTFLRVARRSSNPEDARGKPARLTLLVAPNLAHLLPRRWSLRPSSIERVAESVSSVSLSWLGFPESVTEERPTFAVAQELPPGAIELRARDRSIARASLEPALAGAELRAACDALGLTLGRRLALHGAELLSLDDVEAWLDETAEYAPAAVRAAVPHLFSLPELAEVLRALLRERVPVRHLDVVLEALAKERKSGPPAAELAHLAEVARRALRSSLSRAVTDAGGVVRVVQLDSLLEDTVREALHTSGGKTSCHLAPGAARDIVSAVQRAVAAASSGDAAPTPAVLLTSSAVRRFVRELLAPTLPELSVVCAEELLPELRVDFAGTASPYDLAPVQMAV